MEVKELPPQALTVIEGKLAMEAMGGYMIVVEDKFKTGYECDDCGGKGHKGEPCLNCGGTGRYEDGENCSSCGSTMYHQKIYTGYIPCTACSGMGTKKGLIAPQTAERRATTGIVKSVGPDCITFKPGDHVLWTTYAGHALDYKQVGVVRVLAEKEILVKLHKVAGATITEEEAGKAID